MIATTSSKVRLSVLATAAALSAMTGAAYAAGLPDAASAILQQLGVSSHGSATDTHGATVSNLARTTTAVGAAKGAAIAAVASDGRSLAAAESGDSGTGDTELHGNVTVAIPARQE